MRVKAKCSKCDSVIALFFDENDPDVRVIRGLNKGELFEHKCPSCEEWAAFEVVE